MVRRAVRRHLQEFFLHSEIRLDSLLADIGIGHDDLNRLLDKPRWYSPQRRDKARVLADMSTESQVTTIVAILRRILADRTYKGRRYSHVDDIKRALRKIERDQGRSTSDNDAERAVFVFVDIKSHTEMLETDQRLGTTIYSELIHSALAMARKRLLCESSAVVKDEGEGILFRFEPNANDDGGVQLAVQSSIGLLHELFILNLFENETYQSVGLKVSCLSVPTATFAARPLEYELYIDKYDKRYGRSNTLSIDAATYAKLKPYMRDLFKSFVVSGGPFSGRNYQYAINQNIRCLSL